MGWFGRWLDPPERRAYKQAVKAGLAPRPEGAGLEVGVAVPLGRLVPLAIAAVVLVGAGVLIGSRIGQPATPGQIVVRVIDDGAAGGPAVLSTQVVPLR